MKWIEHDITVAHMWELIAFSSLFLMLRFQGRIWPLLFLSILLIWSIDAVMRQHKQARS